MADEARVSQDVAEVLDTFDPLARASQSTSEVVQTFSPTVRVSQVTVELMHLRASASQPQMWIIT